MATKYSTKEAHCVGFNGEEAVTFKVGDKVEYLVGDAWVTAEVSDIFTYSLAGDESTETPGISATLSFTDPSSKEAIAKDVNLSADETSSVLRVIGGAAGALASAAKGKPDASAFDLEKLLSSCIELVSRSNLLIYHIYENEDLGIIDKALGRDDSGKAAASADDGGKKRLGALDPTTVADIAAQKLIAGSLRQAFPLVNICGEEGVLEYTGEDIVNPVALRKLYKPIFDDDQLTAASVGDKIDAHGSIFLRAQSTDSPMLFSDEKVDGDEIGTVTVGVSPLIIRESRGWNPKDVFVWIDPLDGTKEFTEGIKSAVTTLCGIAYRGRPIAGIIGRPFAESKQSAIIWSVLGVGVYAQPRQDEITDKTAIAAIEKSFVFDHRSKDDRVICTSRSHFAPSMRSYISVCEPTGFVRSGGCGGKVLMIAEGVADAYVFPSLGTKKWDTCAVEALAMTLGGALSKPDGGFYYYGSNKKEDYMNFEGFVVTLKGNDGATDESASDNGKALMKKFGGYHSSFLAPLLGDIQGACSDVTLFGVTGVTGKRALLWILTRYGDDEKWRFACAGRNLTKVQSVLDDIEAEMDGDASADDGAVMYDKYGYRFTRAALKRLRLVKCDAMNAAQCEAMVRRTAVVVSTVGPFARYGENIIAACVKYGVDYCDTTGEYFWVKRMALKYECEAIRSHARIINCAAFVSFPVDTSVRMGVDHLIEGGKFDPKSKADEIIQADTAYKMRGGSQSGGTLHSTLDAMTGDSKKGTGAPKVSVTRDYLYMVNGKPDVSRTPSDCLRQEWRTVAYRAQLPSSESTPQVWPKWDKKMNAYRAPHWYGIVDRMTVWKSNFQSDLRYGRRFRMNYPSLCFKRKRELIPYLMIVSFIGLMTASNFGMSILRFIILKVLPLLESLSLIRLPQPGEGTPLDKEVKQSCDMLTTVTNQSTGAKVDVRIRMAGGPGYYLTSRMCVENALMCAKQRKGLPTGKAEASKKASKPKIKGGFLTTASAFGSDVLQEMASCKPTYMDVTVTDNFAEFDDSRRSKM